MKLFWALYFHIFDSSSKYPGDNESILYFFRPFSIFHAAGQGTYCYILLQSDGLNLYIILTVYFVRNEDLNAARITNILPCLANY